MSHKQLKAALFTVAFAGTLGPCGASEADQWLQDIGLLEPPRERKTAAAAPKKSQAEQSESGTPKRTMRSGEDVVLSGEESASKLRTYGEKALKDGKFDRAMKLLERSIELQPDVQTRALYAEAAEFKLKQLDKADPALFNLCVKQWFYVFKHSEFLEDSQKAGRHLKELTGKAPSLMSLASTYLPDVLMSEEDTADEPQAVVEPPQVH